ncbi:MAG TPA: zinc ribbon domain-containing protein [Roseiflexaceae bacterium]|nr:zinc ribbon domain-containing protein [Roseiflexaceae bacterium]
MGFLDNISKSISQGVDRAKFEADKFQRTTRIQGEINELKRQIDGKRAELGDRAFDLYKAGQIQSSTLGDLVMALEALRTNITLKEEDLKAAQSETFVEPTPPVGTTPPPAQNVAPRQGQPVSVAKTCANCQFQMPASAVFCPNCGARQSA